MQLIGAIKERDAHFHRLLGVFRGANQQAGGTRDVKNRFVLTGGDSTGFEIVELVILRRGIFARGFLP